MMENKLEVFDSLLLKNIELNPTKLYKLTPIGMNTEDVESLSGYIERLAEAHCVSTGTLYKFIFQSDNFSTISNKQKVSQSLNGIGNLTEIFIRTLEELTGQDNLNRLVLIKFKDIISNSNLLRKQKSWCPVCLNNMQTANSPVYEKLLWNLNYYNVCHLHHVKLESKCPNCKKAQIIVHFRSKSGHCHYCNYWLGNSKEKYITIPSDNDEFFYSSQLSYLFTHLSHREDLKEDFISLFLHINENFLLGNNKKENCKKIFSVEHSAFNKYCDGMPFNLLFLLKLSQNLGLGFNELFDKDIVFPVEYLSEKYKQQKALNNALEYLNQILKSDELISFQQITDHLGIKFETLYYRYPNLINDINKKNKRLGVLPFNRNNNNEIKKALENYLEDDSVYKSLKQISYELNISSFTLRRKFPTIWSEIKYKNDNLRRKYLVSKDNSISESKLDIVDLRNKIIEQINLINTEPITIGEICKKIKISRPTFKEYFPDLVVEIKARNSEAIKKRQLYKLNLKKELIVKAIHNLHSNGIYPSTRLVEDKLSFSLVYKKDLMQVWRNTLMELGIPYRQN